MDVSVGRLTEERQKEQQRGTQIKQSENPFTKRFFLRFRLLFGDGQHVITGQKLIDCHGEKFRYPFQ
ncbi:MAG: hypothetical protein J6C42_08900, partial [Clostridia bacterium]|nr:hypothetical protein [Clostridia bacterium]